MTSDVADLVFASLGDGCICLAESSWRHWNTCRADLRYTDDSGIILCSFMHLIARFWGYGLGQRRPRACNIIYGNYVRYNPCQFQMCETGRRWINITRDSAIKSHDTTTSWDWLHLFSFSLKIGFDQGKLCCLVCALAHWWLVNAEDKSVFVLLLQCSEMSIDFCLKDADAEF